jgi:hypothetical protein
MCNCMSPLLWQQCINAAQAVDSVDKFQAVQSPIESTIRDHELPWHCQEGFPQSASDGEGRDTKAGQDRVTFQVLTLIGFAHG